MTDVRLTATNPADSSVVPVACNEKGELKLEEPLTGDFVAKAGDTMTGNLHLGDKIVLNPDGSAQFAGGAVDVYIDGKATFASKVVSGSLDTTNTEGFGCQLSFGSSGEGRIVAQAKSTVTSPGTRYLFQGYKGTDRVFRVDANGKVIADGGIASDGSATFAGDIQIHGSPLDNQAGCRIYERLIAQGIDQSAVDKGNSVYLVKNSDTGKNIFQVAANGQATSYGSGFRVLDSNGILKAQMAFDGSATFAGDVVVGSRNKQWMLVESGGICHMVEQTRAIDTADLEKEYPELRNLPQELDQLSAVVTALLTEVQRVEEKLRMAPESGWPVWDGSD